MHYIHSLLFFGLITFSVFATSGDEIYKYHKADGSVVFSNIKPNGRTIARTFKFDCYACTLNSAVNWHETPLYLTKYSQEIGQASSKYAVNPALIKAVIHAESSFRPHVVSKVGAQGLMQLMPETAIELGVKKPFNVGENISGGTQYLAKLLAIFKGDVSLATAAYNSGASNVQRFGGIPPFPETQAYVKRIKILHKRYQQANSNYSVAF